MKVISLEIHEFRGIRHLSLALNGKNASVYGPNGSGKSGVVDALDFLLTGKITRLIGEGTFGCTLKEHGKHIDADINDSYVKGILSFDKLPQGVEVKRFVNKPNEPIYEEKFRGIVEPILKMAARGHHVLARKNLLDYVVAKSSDRGKAIQGLLNINELENVRTTLMKNKNLQKNKLDSENATLNNVKSTITQLCDQKAFSEDLVVKYINQCRAILNGSPINQISSTDLLAGIALPESSSGKSSINTTTLFNDYRVCSDFASLTSRTSLEDTCESFFQAAKYFLENPKNQRLLNLENLIRHGIDLLDDSGSCPLCDTEWLPDKLQVYLTAKLDLSKNSCIQKDKVIDIGDSLNKSLLVIITSIKSLLRKLDLFAPENTLLADLTKWQQNIDRTMAVVKNPFEQQNLVDLKTVLDTNWIFPDFVASLLDKILQILESNKVEKTPEQAAWDNLTKLTVPVSTWEKNIASVKRQSMVFEWSSEIYRAFIESRDAVLKNLYDSITDRFVSLYRTMHQDDENDFSASIVSTETGVDFSVDFYGRGKQPPQALHSEGHQDSMGICLYLALAEKLTEGFFNLIVLDDVVMSVDADHRRQFSKLLGAEFPEIQFVITTHDRIWAFQLKYDGIIPSSNSYEFNDWTIELGPSIRNEGSEDWDRIYRLARANEISQASAMLRRTSEQFFATVCEQMGGRVLYRADNQRTLGELGSAINCRYKELLEKSKKAYASWADEDGVEKATLMEANFKRICKEKEIETWAINPTTHYNEWATFSSNDFLPIVDAFRRFFDSFRCSKCGSIIKLNKSNNNTNASLSCKCKDIDLNLESRSG